MNRSIPFLFALLVLIASLLGCGGGGGGNGGGGNTVRVTGYVLDVVSGGALSPAPVVQVGSRTVTVNADDGSFAIDAPRGATEVLVNTQPYGTFRFTIPALTEDTDLDALWVGPSKVTVQGTVLDATNGSPVANATVLFGGRRGTTNAQGAFSLAEVAYAPNGAFGSIEGTARATGYFAGTFDASGLSPTGGVIHVGEVLLTPTGDDSPPPGPYNIWGRVSPIADAPGAVVTLLENGTPVRQTTVGQDGRYYFWVPAGTYSLDFVKGNLRASASVTLTGNDQVIQRDVTLSAQ